MLDLDQLKHSPETLALIDWDMTPQAAFEAYQIKSPNAWKSRNLAPAAYFCLEVWQGRTRALLVTKTMVDSEETALLPVPDHLVQACLAAQAGANPPSGQYPIDEAIKAWLAAALKKDDPAD